MKTSQITFLGFALFITLKLTAGHHLPNCGLGQGTDVCGCSSVVKAAPLPRPGRLFDPEVIYEVNHMKKNPTYHGCGSLNSSNKKKVSRASIVDLLNSNCGPVAPRFRPVGDLCTKCKTSVAEVIPAYPGKPQCNSCAQKALKYESCLSDPRYAKQTYTSFSNGNTELNSFDDEGLSFDEQENIYNSQNVPYLPADPVSLSLAFKMAQQTMNKPISEASLNFGARSIPVDGSVKKITSNIPEEKLFTIEKPLVELKFAPQSADTENYDELIAEQEALEQKRLELEAQAEERSQSQGFISYSELGYAPVTSNGNQFVNTEPSEKIHYEETPCGPLGPAIPEYQSGNVIIRSDPDQQYEEEESFEDDDSGEDSYEESDFNSDYSFEDAKPCTGFLARLRASARAQNEQSGCGCGY